MSDLRNRLLASRALSSDAIQFAGAIDEAANDLRRLARGLVAAARGGNRPGTGTLKRLAVIERRLDQAAQAYARGRV